MCIVTALLSRLCNINISFVCDKQYTFFIFTLKYQYQPICNTSNKCFDIAGVRLLNADVQKPAPHFKGTAVVGNDFREISLDDYKGKYLVLFFYPLDL